MKSATARTILSKSFLVTLAVSCSVSAYANTSGQPPHLELEMTSREYLPLVAPLLDNGTDDVLTAVLAAGKINLDWLDLVNNSRAAGERLELSTAATQRGYPIDAPGTSNRPIIMAKWNDALAAMPESMRQVYLAGATATASIPEGLSDEAFLEHIRVVDRVYQSASRWLLQEPYLASYAARANEDVRGFYYLSKETDLQATLQSWQTLSTAEQERLAGHLVGLCTNSDKSMSSCRAALQRSIARDGEAWTFYNDYLKASQELWESYFEIPATRDDVTWNGRAPEVFSIPFRDPGREDVKNWLQFNIEDEWRWDSWALKLDFKPSGGDSMTHVVFEAGATPHVNGIAGSQITMDGNRSIAEYTSRWTIRHEYGHVLGFPDCYVEFYDKSVEAMVNYQLDVTNLMCSRKGKLQPKHVDELRRVYYQD